MSTPKLLQEGPAFTDPNQQVRMICISCCAKTSGAALPKVPKPGFGQSPDHGWESFLTRRQLLAIPKILIHGQGVINAIIIS